MSARTAHCVFAHFLAWTWGQGGGRVIILNSINARSLLHAPANPLSERKEKGKKKENTHQTLTAHSWFSTSPLIRTYSRTHIMPLRKFSAHTDPQHTPSNTAEAALCGCHGAASATLLSPPLSRCHLSFNILHQLPIPFTAFYISFLFLFFCFTPSNPLLQSYASSQGCKVFEFLNPFICLPCFPPLSPSHFRLCSQREGWVVIPVTAPSWVLRYESALVFMRCLWFNTTGQDFLRCLRLPLCHRGCSAEVDLDARTRSGLKVKGVMYSHNSRLTKGISRGGSVSPGQENNPRYSK